VGVAFRRPENEILDESGKVVDSITGSKHGGLNRASWFAAAAIAPPAANVLFDAAIGPRLLPGPIRLDDEG
jgi:hypothetical protein